MEQPLYYGQKLPRAEDTHSIMEDFFNFSPSTRIVEFATMMNEYPITQLYGMKMYEITNLY